ncbi:MAG TPA: VOC family protein [Ornithinibacter sp.]|nr:VOC family protein [Ornithinibacter sp.]
MRITRTSVFVDDQARALDFYTGTLGFTVRHDIPMGEFRWLTVVSPEEVDGVELVLEPNEHPAAKAYTRALAEDGIPSTSFTCDDVEAEHERLTGLGVTFTQPPVPMGPVVTAVFDDTCGNLVQLVSPVGSDESDASEPDSAGNA